MMSRPATITVPLSGSIMRLITRIVVVLPHPDGPMRTHTSPAGTVSVRWSIAGRGAPANCFVRPRISITACAGREGVSDFCRWPKSWSVPIDRSVAGMAPTKSCGSAIIAMPAVMKSPRPPPPM